MLRGRLFDIIAGSALLTLVVLDWLFKMSPWVYAGWGILYVGIKGLGSAVISSQFFIHVRCQGTSDDAIALTFDDGPVIGNTEKILDVLKEYGAPAAFFCIGCRADRSPELIERMHLEGHLVGNHSYYHGKLFDLQSPAQMTAELKETDRVIQKVIGLRPRFFRPPYGVTNPMLARSVSQGQYTAVGWNVRSLDTVIKKKETLLKRVTRRLKAGDLVLLHDHASVTLEALPELLDTVKKKGFRIERLDVLLKERPYA